MVRVGDLRKEASCPLQQEDRQRHKERTMAKCLLVIAIIRALTVGDLDITEVQWCVKKAHNPVYCLQHPEKTDHQRITHK
jgi:hypothetical protein